MSLPTYLNLTAHETQTAAAIFDRLFPPDDHDPGAVEIGVLDYLDRALSGPYHDILDWYRVGLRALDECAVADFSQPFHLCSTEQQDTLLIRLEQGALDRFAIPPQMDFFAMLLKHVREGIFADPFYGGNRDKAGWRFLRHPGIWLEHTVEEQMADEPVDKDGNIQSLQDLQCDNDNPTKYAGYNPQSGAKPPDSPTDVILVGLGAVGGIIAPRLTQAGLKVVALEAGPWRSEANFLPDELGIGFYGRAGLGPKFNREVPRWRWREDSPTREATFGYGRMVNGVGGSLTHYGGWLRRFHPHHFQMRSYAEARWGQAIIPKNSTLADWPINYETLEPYYTELEHSIGVAGEGSDNPYIPRSKPLPMPPLRPFKLGERFKDVTMSLGYHPFMVPVGVNSVPYDGRPATRYHPWSVGFGAPDGDRWDPSLTSIPKALASGNLDLRTHCRVLRVLTDCQGHASGVEYVNASGERHVQEARTVILCAYTWETVRLLFLSGDNKHRDGLGNNNGQLGKNFITKTSTHVGGLFDNDIWNRHTGPAAQGMLVDDLLSTEFDSGANGFLGGASAGMEMQTAPLRISLESRPTGVPAWGQAYKDHLRKWQQVAFIGVQQDSLPYSCNYLDLDPHHRDSSGLGLPVIRATYEVQANEHRISDFMESWCENILREMGASNVWRGGRFLGVGSCHELGGARMGEDPHLSVVNRDLQVHDTPGLYVYGGATFPSCPGINPTLTIFAACLHAIDRLIERLGAT